MLSEFIVGQQYSNDQISISLQVENLGGIRPSVDKNKKLRHIAIMTKLDGNLKNILENPYQDRIEGDVLTFTGQGRSGDQQLTGRNKRITEQFSAPIPLFCFESTGRQSYTFRGLLELLRFNFEPQIDSSRKLRNVLVFEFSMHSALACVPIELAMSITDSFLPRNRNQQDQDLVFAPVAETEANTEQIAFPLIEIEEIRARLLAINPYRFEVFLKAVVESKGFQNVSTTPPSRDGGIDIVAHAPPNDLFFSNTLVQFQAKRWRHSVGSVEINNFRGAISSAAKGVFVTTSFFTKAAIQEAQNSSKPSIALIDGLRLASVINDIQIDISKFEDR